MTRSEAFWVGVIVGIAIGLTMHLMRWWPD